MMLLLPLGSGSVLARPPRVTIALILLCTIVFPLTRGEAIRASEREVEKLERVAGWSLEVAARATPELAAARAEHDSALAYLVATDSWRELVRDDELRARLESCASGYRELAAASPIHRHGLVPADVTPWRLVAHQFLHGDPFHLFFNMVFLWAAGAYVEHLWGPLPYLALYLGSGVAAALTHAASYPGSTEPAIGASGAIAGVMGAFAATLGTRRVPMAFAAMISLAPRIKVLDAPAFIFPTLWAGSQLLYLSVPIEARMGIAVEAHLGGFAAGVLAALLLRRFLPEVVLEEA